jgi:hypothetical protein
MVLMAGFLEPFAALILEDETREVKFFEVCWKIPVLNGLPKYRALLLKGIGSRDIRAATSQHQAGDKNVAAPFFIPRGVGGSARVSFVE